MVVVVVLVVVVVVVRVLMIVSRDGRNPTRSNSSKSQNAAVLL